VSIKLDLYPRHIIPKQGVRLVVINPTNADQDVTVKFVADSTVVAEVVFDAVKSGEVRDAVATYDDLGLGSYAGRTLAVYPEIPSPASGVVLLGTSEAPSTKGNAIALKVESTVELTIVDEEGKAVPFAHVDLLDQLSGEHYHYVADADGKVVLPERVTADEGRWVLEVYKYDYATRLTYYNLIKDFDFTNRSVTVYKARQFQVDVGFHAPLSDTVVDKVMQNIRQWMPGPLGTVVDNMAGALGWLHTRVINTIWNWVTSIYARRAGVRLIGAWYDSENSQLRIRLLIGQASPTAGIVIGVIILIAVLFLMGYRLYIEYVRITKQAEIQETIARREAIKKEIIDEITRQYNEGNITKETYENAIKNISEAFDEQSANTPAVPFDISTVMALVSLFLAVVIIVSLVKVFK